MRTEFFMPMLPPTITHQQKKIKKVNGKIIVYEPAKLSNARSKLLGHLASHIPAAKYTTAVRLTTKWLFPITGKHYDGEWKTTKPDTDNMVKLLKDCMTTLGYWTDDALVASEIIEKFWAARPGIYIKIEEV